MSLSFVHASSSTLTHSAINPTGGYCFKCGVNTTYSDNANALTGAASSGTAHIQLRIWTDGKLEVRRWSGSLWNSVFSTSAVNDGNNHDIEIYHTTSASNNVLIYIDGKLDSTRTLSYTTSSTFESLGIVTGKQIGRAHV